jgi:hypothetical protein
VSLAGADGPLASQLAFVHQVLIAARRWWPGVAALIVRQNMRTERAKLKSCKDDELIAQGKRSAALGGVALYPGQRPRRPCPGLLSGRPSGAPEGRTRCWTPTQESAQRAPRAAPPALTLSRRVLASLGALLLPTLLRRRTGALWGWRCQNTPHLFLVRRREYRAFQCRDLQSATLQERRHFLLGGS